MSSLDQYIICFAVGGAFCVIGQLLISLTRLTPARVLVIFVTSGVILTAIGVYPPLVEISGAGATVPLTGFGYCLAKGAAEGARSGGIIGAISGGIKETAAGISAAIVSGFVVSLIFRPGTKS